AWVVAVAPPAESVATKLMEYEASSVGVPLMRPASFIVSPAGNEKPGASDTVTVPVPPTTLRRSSYGTPTAPVFNWNVLNVNDDTVKTNVRTPMLGFPGVESVAFNVTGKTPAVIGVAAS